MKLNTTRVISIAAVILSGVFIALPNDIAAQSGGERATSIKSDIAQDEARLEELHQDVAVSSRLFEEFTSNATLFEEQAEEVAAEIDALEAESDEPDLVVLAELKLRRLSLAERASQEKRKAALTVEAIKIGRTEIALVEQKIANGKATLGILLGKGLEESAGMPVPDETRDFDRELPDEPRLVKAPGSLSALIPGEEGKPTPVESPGKTGLSETADQIQARKNADKADEVALQAEQQLLESVERKQALLEQVELEKAQLELAEDSLRVINDELGTIERNIAQRLLSGEPEQALRSERERIADLEELRDDIESVLESRETNLQANNSQLEEMEGFQVGIAAEVERTRQAAEDARKAENWAYSPFNPDNIIRWLKLRGPGILYILAIMLALLMVTRFTARRVIRFLVRSARPVDRPLRAQRAETVAASLGSVITGIVMIIAILVVLSEAGVEVTAVLGGAAILGVAVAFGAQNLMKDYFNGIMILLEDQYGLDDLVSIGEVSGRIERVSLRTTVVRDIEGRLHFFPNGQITLVTNRSYMWSRAVFDIPVPYDCDIDRAMEILMDEANTFCEDMNYTSSVADKPVMLGVDQFAESAIILRFYIKTAPAMHLPVRREMLRRVKNRFDSEGISIPFPHRVIVSKDEAGKSDLQQD